jgi:hypothetical protein
MTRAFTASLGVAARAQLRSRSVPRRAPSTSGKGVLPVRRLLLAATVSAALFVAGTFVLVSNSSQAFAASSLTCTGVSGRFYANITIRKCNVPSADVKAYKSASVSVASLTSGGTFTWSKSGATTTLDPASISSPGRGRCGSSDTEQDITAMVTGGTSVVTREGDSFSADVCVFKTTMGYMSGMTHLVKGTKADI